MYAEFDTKTGFIHLTSKDKRLKKKPFKIAVTGSSPSYETLLNLIEDEIEIEKIELPERSRSVSTDELISGKSLDPRTSLNIGENTDGVETWDLSINPHTLIHGTIASGLTFLTTAILSYANSLDSIKLYAADCKAIEISEKRYTSKDTNIAKTKDAILEMIDEVFETIQKRYEMLEELGINNFSEVYQMKSVFFVIDAFDELDLDENEFEIVMNKINSIIRLGRAAGIHLFITTRSVNNRYLDNLNMTEIGRIVAKCNSRDFISLTKSAPNWSGAYTQPMGRCIVSTYGNKQSLVQVYYVEKDNNK